MVFHSDQSLSVVLFQSKGVGAFEPVALNHVVDAFILSVVWKIVIGKVKLVA